MHLAFIDMVRDEKLSGQIRKDLHMLAAGGHMKITPHDYPAPTSISINSNRSRNVIGHDGVQARRKHGRIRAHWFLSDLLTAQKSNLLRIDCAHKILLLTDAPLTVETAQGPCNFVYGVASDDQTVGVVSVFDIRRQAPPDDVDALTGQVVLHELGHMLGLPSVGRVDTEDLLGLHCTRANCFMKEFLDIIELTSALRARQRGGPLMCDLCREDLGRSSFA